MTETNFNQLTPSETELLAVLMEECGEVIQEIGKILRHGYESSDPTKENSPTNRDKLVKECGDVLLAISLLAASGAFTEEELQIRMINKLKTIDNFLHHN